MEEDVSDNEGFKAALFAYRNYVTKNGEESSLPYFENFTQEQLFTLAYANVSICYGVKLLIHRVSLNYITALTILRICSSVFSFSAKVY